MNVFHLCLALAPLLLIFILIIVRNMPADIAAFIGWGATFVIACIFFDTSPRVALTASLAGLIKSLPIGLAMGASSFQIFTMGETGALGKVVESIKGLAPTDKCSQMLLINCGLGILFTSVGAVTISIFPPILVALGYTTLTAIALPCLGYTGACIYAIMGVPVVIFAGMAGIELQEAGILFAKFLPFLLFAVSLGCLWVAGGKRTLAQGFLPAAFASAVSGIIALPLAHMGGITLTGIFVGFSYAAVLLIWLKIKGKTLYQPVSDTDATSKLSLSAALSPWLMLILLSLLVNSPFLPFFKLLFSDLDMPLEIIPQRPEKLRVFWQSYLWIPVATLLCAPIIKAGKKELLEALKKTRQRACRPILSIAFFFALSSLYVFSAHSSNWTLANKELNMVNILSASASNALGTLYVLAAPFLGLIGGIISGSQSGSIAMLTKLHLNVADHLKISGSFLALLSALGGGLSGAIAPAKVMNAAAVIGKIGEEGTVLKSIFGVTLILTLSLALFGYLWL